MAAKNKTISMTIVTLANQIARKASAAKIATRISVSSIDYSGFLSGLTASRRGLTTERPDKVLAAPSRA
jgi:hypothetical protein